jgi:Mg-chelatase subunit ChlD
MDHSARDYVLVVDRSASMEEPAKAGSSQTRWEYAQETTMALARKCAAFDDDGIDVYTFNRTFQKFEGTTPENVKQIFASVNPGGSTDFLPVLKDAFDTHFRKGKKPTTIIVLTDGEPSDRDAGRKALQDLIVATSKKLEVDAELAVTFIQVGNDPSATAFLKTLDDDMVKAGAKFDIVDTKTADEVENMTVEQVLEAAVND